MVQVHSGLPNLHRKFEAVLTTCYGAIAQLGARLLCTQEVLSLIHISLPAAKVAEFSAKLADFSRGSLQLLAIEE